MTTYHQRVTRIRSLLQELATGSPLGELLTRHNLSPGKALRMLRSRLARAEIRRLRDLAATQRSAMLHGISSQALQTLASTLHAEKPDPCIKSALNILQLADQEPELDAEEEEEDFQAWLAARP